MKKIIFLAFVIIVSCTKENIYFENNNIKLTESDISELQYKFPTEENKKTFIRNQILPKYKNYVFARDYKELPFDEAAIKQIAVSKAYEENLYNEKIDKLIKDDAYIEKIYQNTLYEFRYDHISIYKSFGLREDSLRKVRIEEVFEELKKDANSFNTLKGKYGINTDNIRTKYMTWGHLPYILQKEIYEKREKGLILKILETSQAYHIIKILDFRKKAVGFYPSVKLFKKDYLAVKGLHVKESGSYQDYYIVNLSKKWDIEYNIDNIDRAYDDLLNANIMDLYKKEIENYDLVTLNNGSITFHDFINFYIGSLYDLIDHIKLKSHFFVPSYVLKLVQHRLRKEEAVDQGYDDIENPGRIDLYVFNEKFNYIKKLYTLSSEVEPDSEMMKKYYQENKDEFVNLDRRYTYGFYLEGKDVDKLRKDYKKITRKNLLKYYNKYHKSKVAKLPLVGILSINSFKNVSEEVFRLKKNQLSEIIKLDGSNKYYLFYYNKEDKGEIISYDDAEERIRQKIIYETKKSANERFFQMIEDYNINSVISI